MTTRTTGYRPTTIANTTAKMKGTTGSLGAPTPIGKQNASIGSVSKQTEKGWEFKTNPNNAKRTDITRTTTNDKETVTTQSKAYTNKKGVTGPEQEMHKGSGTTKTQKPTISKDIRAMPLYEKEFGTKGADGKTRLMGAGDLSAPKETQLGYGVKAETYVNGPSFEMTGGMSARKNGWGLDVDVNLKVDANLLKAGASIEREFKVKVNGEEVAVKVKLGADAQVGINGEVKLRLHVGKDGVSLQAGAEGFAGARGSLSGSLDVSVNGKKVLGGELKLTAAAGAMAGAEFEAGNGKFKAKAYAAVGVGMGVELTGTYSGGQIAKAAGGLALPGTQGW
ncbi:MAG: hypothetical protein IAE78_04360 [Myxococcus sp.]|nr:hypothetical protein [Myxococcus sp.]